MPGDETLCGYCRQPVTQLTGRGHRPRRYCNDACKQAAYRARLTTREAARATLTAWAAAAADHDKEKV